MNPSTVKQRTYRDAARAAAVGLAVNAALGVGKLAAGLASGSFALLSDAVNSLGDVLTSTAVLYALWLAQKPPDKEHPYGHSKAEAIAGLSVALLVGVTAIGIGWEVVKQIQTPNPIPPTWTLWVAGGNVVLKELLYWYTHRVGRRTGSEAVSAAAWDHRSDAMCSAAVCVGLGAAHLGGPGWAVADELAALAVVALILRSGVGLFLQNSRSLMDLQAEDGMVDEVRASASAVTGVRAIEKLRVRKSGIEFFVDIHVVVDAGITVEAGHSIGHAVKDHLLESFPLLHDVFVHIEPDRPAK